MKYVFADFEIDTQLFVISKNHQSLNIEPRIFELLVFFCENNQRPISRAELIEHVWQQRIVSQAAVNRAVSELRKIIEDNPAKPTLIKTISKVGYQFTITPIQQDNLSSAAPTASASAAATSTTRPQRPTRVVLVASLLVSAVLLVGLGYWQSQKQPQGPTAEIKQTERPLSSLKGTSFRARFSPDGEQVVFIHKTSANALAQVWIQGTNTVSRALTSDNYYYTHAIFGPSQEIYASRFDNLHDRRCEIVSIDLATQAVIPIFECAQRGMTQLDYDPKRRKLYFNYRQGVNAPYAIHAYQVSSQRLQQITHPPFEGNLRGDYLLALSPNGGQLAVFEQQANSLSRLKVVDLLHSNENGTSSQTYGSFKAPSGLSWRNQSQLLISDEQGLVLFDLDSQRQRIVKHDSTLGNATVHHNTGKVAFNRGFTTANLYRYALPSVNPANGVPVTNSRFTNYRPVYGNTSNKVAYISTDSGQIELVIQPPQTKAYRFSCDQTIRNLGNYHWSPDDKRLAASINGQLFIYDEAQQRCRRLLPELNNIHYVHYANENTLLFSSDHTGDWQIWMLALGTGQLTQLTQAGGYSVQGDPRDGYLYLTKYNFPGLFRLNIKAQQEQQLIDNLDITAWNRWHKRDGQLYFIDKQQISQLDLESESISSVLVHEGRAPTSFSISFDHRLLLKEKLEGSSAHLWSLVLADETGL